MGRSCISNGATQDIFIQTRGGCGNSRWRQTGKPTKTPRCSAEKEECGELCPDGVNHLHSLCVLLLSAQADVRPQDRECQAQGRASEVSVPQGGDQGPGARG